MTTQQQNIIDSLVAEFERINTTNNRKAFNLIDSNALQEDTNRKRTWKRLSEENLEVWKKAAHEETERIIALLLEDLPDYVEVEKYNERIGKYDAPQLQIRHEMVHCRAHCDDVVSIEVYVKKEHRQDEYGNAAEFGKCFRYIPHPMYYGNIPNYEKGYETIEEAVNDPNFKEALRKRVIR